MIINYKQSMMARLSWSGSIPQFPFYSGGLDTNNIRNTYEAPSGNPRGLLYIVELTVRH